MTPSGSKKIECTGMRDVRRILSLVPLPLDWKSNQTNTTDNDFLYESMERLASWETEILPFFPVGY